MKNVNIITDKFGPIVFFLVFSVLVNGIALGGDPDNDLQKTLSLAPEAYNKLDIEDKQEEVNDPSKFIEFRVEASEWLLKIGDIDGLQAVLPAIYKLTQTESSAEEEKIINNYLRMIDPKIFKKQILKLITSDKERKYIRTTAIGIAIIMRNYFTSSEIKKLIQDKNNQHNKIGLIVLLGYVGNIKDVPFLLKLADKNPEEIGEIQVKAINTLSFMATTKHWPNDPPCRLIDRKVPLKIYQIVNNRWKSWWEKYTEIEEQEGKGKSK